MNKPTIVIPTYWGSPDQQNYLFEEVVYDHPTPLDSDGTLTSFLDSLEILNDQNFSVTVIVVPNSDQVAAKVFEKVTGLIKKFRDKYEISVLHPQNLEILKQKLQEKGVGKDSTGFLNLSNYAAVRNVCSIAGILNESDLTIFIDDDEVFTDPDFLKKAQQFAGKKYKGVPVHAVAGYYLQPNTYLIENKTSPDWCVPFWDKTAAMNRAFEEIIGNKPRLKITPFVFGGNMVIDLETLMKVPFDPKITRGEDIDFLINLRIAGINFYLDNKLAIKHLPPSAHRPEWKNLREDVRRFLYEKKKLDDHKDLPGLKPEDLDPYPGMFLHDDITERIIKTVNLLMKKYQKEKDSRGEQECRKLIQMTKIDPFEKIDTKIWLQKITADWKLLTEAVRGLGITE